MKKLKLYGYIPSVSEYNKYYPRFRAFMSADVRVESKISCVDEMNLENNDYLKGYFPLRTPRSTYEIYCGFPDGRLDFHFESMPIYGLRLAFNLIYNPKSKIVKKVSFEERTTEVYSRQEGEIKITGKAPIIIFGGRKCIWLNKEECENGQSKVMECWSLDIIEKARHFSNKQPSNYGNADKLHKQCDEVLKRSCSEEELAMIVPVEMSEEDNYETATPILEKEEILGQE